MATKDRSEEVWQDGCFVVKLEAGQFWVTELLHTPKGDVPKRWRIKFSSVENSRHFIATRLRDDHERLYHVHVEAVAR